MLGTMRWFTTVALLWISAPLDAECRVGVAQIDITPNHPVRLHGFGGRRAESDGVWQRIKASAIAIDNVVLIAVDNLGVPASMTADVAKRLGIPVERLAICATHTHTAPMLNGVAPTIFGTAIPPEHQKHIDQYTREFTDKLVEVGKAAIADRKPAKLSWGVGSVGFAINRRTKGGPVDHDLPLLAVHGEDKKLRAVVIGYACHCVTLANNKIGGDWAGCTREAIEAAHPGAIALVTIGCGADQNPNARAQGDNPEAAVVQGRAIAGEVDRLLKQFLAPVRGPIGVSARNVNLAFDVPSRKSFEENAKRSDAVGYHAKLNLARLDKGEPLTSQIDYSIRAWTFGEDLAMAFLPGEVVVDFSLRLKKELDGRRIWVTAYSNDSPCYIPSERVLKEGGYEGGDAMVYYDKPGPLKSGLEEKIIGAVKESIGPKFAPAFDPNKVKPPPLSPQQSLAKIQVDEKLSVDLVAAEPLVQSPVAISFGADGQMFVAEMSDYPSGVKGDFGPGGRVSLLSDRDESGIYRTSTVFLDNIPFPTGVTAWRKGVLICAAPDILYAEDTDGDGKADVVRKLYSGFGTENFQARVNSLEYGLDGWVYGSCGLYGGTIKSFSGVVCELGNRDFRIKPDTGEIEPATGRTQQGRVRDDWDNWFGCDNSNLAWHYPLPDHYIRRNPHAAPSATLKVVSEEPDPNRVFPASKDLQLFKLSGASGRATAACGIGIYRDNLLGAEYQGNLFVCEPVNLLVHRMVLTPSGSSFAGRRAPGEKTREFLASTDPWFRPVQVRTGPDGCLYVVDMARYVIEHPRWIPPGELDKVDVRAGSNLGRIYRVRPADLRPRRIPRLETMTITELQRALNTPNGPVRDYVIQKLIDRKEHVLAPALGFRLETGRPETRLGTLVALDGARLLGVDHVRQALTDKHSGIRRHAVRLAERFIDQLGPDLLKMAETDEHVRLQLALTLGRVPGRTCAIALADFKCADQFMRSAVMSSLNSGNLRPFLHHAVNPFSPPAPEMIRGALGIAVASGDHESVRVALNRGVTMPQLNPDTTAVRVQILAEVLQLFARSGRSIDDALDEKTKGLMLNHLATAQREAAESRIGQSNQLAAISVLGWYPPSRESEMPILVSLLSVLETPQIQSAAAAALARIADPSVPKLLLAAWPDAAPALQKQILDLLLTRSDGPAALLDAIEKQTIPARFIDAGRRQQFLKHKDASIRARAVKLFETSANTDRGKVVKEFEDVAKLAGDADRGKTIYANRCATCHRFGDTGHAVGPDLHSLTNKSPQYLLQEILDPNRALDSRYVEYAATTKAGKVLRGIIVAETATSVTLRAADGKDDVLLRKDIDTLESSGRSLMPEGFEKDLSRQDLADVMAYVNGKPR